MLKKRDRLRAEEIKEVLTRKAIPVSTSFFNMRVLRKNTEKPFDSKFAVTVTKKMYKSAVDRHHMKRRVMEALRLTKHIFPQNLYISIMPKPDTAALSFEELLVEVENISKRIRKG
ncbi:MAG: ribonuclease P protein component [Candidatus Gracilibacteria bacterium]